MRQFKQCFRDLSIYSKFIFTFIALVIIPCIVWTVVLSFANYDIRFEKEKDRIKQTLQLVKTNIELELEKYELKARGIYQYPSIFEEYRNKKDNRLTNYQLLDVSSILKGIRANESNLNSVCLFLENGQKVCGSSVRGFDGQEIYAHREWFEEAEELNGKGFWITTFPVKSQNDTLYNISFCFMVKDVYSSFQNVGVMFTNVDVGLIDGICKNLDIGKDSILFITDSEEQIVWTADKNALGGNLSDYNSELKGNRYRTFQISLDNGGWKYILYVPVSSLLEQFQAVILNNILLLLLLFLLFMICIRILAKNIIAPIRKMTLLTAKVNTPDFEKGMTMTGNDEIGVLAKNFLHMKREMIMLIEQTKSAEKKEREQAIMALQAQINPHFLYNTLDTLFWMADEKEETEICEMVQALSELLRYSIGKKNVNAKIGDEINNIRNYVYLQKMRFENLFCVEYDVSTEIYKYSTFKLILQPFVENSIVHGFCDRTEGGIIQIKGILERGRIIFEINDNGCGISEERIDFIMSNKNDHIGVSNIYGRIQYLYGAEYGISVSSTPGHGTSVRIEIPAIEFDKE